MNLVRAELARLAGRRFVHLMLVLLIAAFGITVATTVASSHNPSAAEVAWAEREAAQSRRLALVEYNRCMAAQRPGAPDDLRHQFPRDCEVLRPTEVHPEDFLYGVFVFEREIRPLVYFLIAFLAMFGFLVGASYIGADLNTGGVTNLLLWQPQRLRVLGAKLGTLLSGTVVLSVLASAVYLGVFWLIAQARGLPGDLDSEFWNWLGLTWSRGLAVVLGATTLGFAIATLGRHTAAALGAVAAYGIVWEAGGRIVMEIIEVARPDQWMLLTYLEAWMTGEVQLFDRYACRGDDSAYRICDGLYTLTWKHALAVFSVVIAGLVVGAFVNFRRRDLI